VNATYIIKRPLVTEKSTYLMNEQGRYAFEVDVGATKTQIKAAIESLYKVKVVGINTQVRKGRSRRLRYGVVQERPTKKAIVRLREGDAIELF
jgi:large subunit ribosomal protein L23